MTEFTWPREGAEYTIKWREPFHSTMRGGQPLERETNFKYIGYITDSYGLTLLNFECLTTDTVDGVGEGERLEILVTQDSPRGALISEGVFADFQPFGLAGKPISIKLLERDDDADTASVGPRDGSDSGSDSGFGSIQYWKRKAATKKNWNSKVVDRFYGLYSRTQ